MIIEFKQLMWGGLLLCLIGCTANPPTSTPAPIVSVATTSDPNPTAIILNTVVPIELQPAVVVATLPPSGANVPVLGEMQFFSNNNPTPSDEFIAPNEVFVQFEYANIPDGAALRRDWYFNNALFISREEPWDGDAFGRDGLRNDISIFDYESGLAFGVYQLDLFIDGVPQGNRTFVISPSAANTSPAPVIGQKFSNLSFKGLGSYSMEFGDRLERPTEMFAEWYYVDMTANDVVRRDWYFNDALFITKEEAWDLAAFGAEGYQKTVSIFDYETGLAEGIYRLELFVNGAFQVVQTVEVVPPYELAPLTDATSGKQLSSENINTISVVNPDGSVVTKSVSGRIHSADWFSGGDRLIFASTILVDPSAPFAAFAHLTELWLWDIPTDTLVQMGAREDRYHSPRVSPDGKHVAILSGSGYGDACSVDLRLIILQLDAAGGLTGNLVPSDFGLPNYDVEQVGVWTVNQDESYRQNLVQTSSDWIVSAGTWANDSMFRTNLGFSDCSDKGGLYEFNLNDFSSQKIQ